MDRFFSTLLLILLFHISSAQWVKTNGPYGGTAYVLQEVPDGVLMGSSNGVYKSKDNGVSWQRSNDGIGPDQIIRSLYISSSNVVFAGTQQLPLNGSQGRVFKSTDNGESWEMLPYDFPGTVWDITSFKGALYVGLNIENSFVSTDEGANWSQINSVENIRRMVPHGDWMFAIDFYSDVIYRSADGLIWEVKNTGIPDQNSGGGNGLIDMVSSGNKIYVGLSGGGFFMSEDDGESWVDINNGLANRYKRLEKIYYKNGKLFGLTMSGDLATTDDDGANWSTIDSVYPNTGYDIMEANGVTFTAFRAAGVFTSSGSLDSWVNANDGFDGAIVDKLITLPNGVLSAGWGAGIHYTEDQGDNWIDITDAGSPFYIDIEVIGETIITSTASNSFTNGGLYRTSSIGMDWQNLNWSFIPPNSFAHLDDALYATTQSLAGVIVSLDSGDTWNFSGGDLISNETLYDIEAVNGTLFTRGNEKLFRSTDSAQTWEQIGSDFWSLENQPGILHSDQNGFLYSSKNSNSSSFNLSFNNGDSWDNIVVDPNNSTFVNAFVGSDGVMMVGTEIGFYYSLDTGKNFIQNNLGLTNLNINTLTSNNDFFYAGTEGGGIYKIRFFQVVSIGILDIFYEQTIGDEWSQNEGWSSGILSNRFGITYNSGQGVIAISLENNNLKGVVTKNLIYLKVLEELSIANNELIGLPDLSGLNSLKTLSVANNRLGFEFLEPNISIETFTYAPQKPLSLDESEVLIIGDSYTLNANTQSANNSHQWFKNDVAIDGETSFELTLESVELEDSGIYHCEITNAVITDLTLTTGKFDLEVREPLYQNELPSFSLYPNPLQGSFLNLEMNKKMHQVEIEVLNLSGQRVSKQFHAEAETVSINLEGKPNGVYLVQVSALDMDTRILKFIKSE